jgi:hypothetical protein
VSALWAAFPAASWESGAVWFGVSASAGRAVEVGCFGASVLRVVRCRVRAAGLASAVLFSGLW